MTVPIVLAAAGVALLVFGALVLLRFPDKPGGTIQATFGGQGIQVSSLGAGLPIMVIGATLLVLAVFTPVSDRRGPSPEGGGSPSLVGPSGSRVCPDRLLEDVEEQRVSTVEEGVIDQTVLGPDQSLSGVFGIRLNDDGTPVGAIRLRFSPDSQVFKVGAVADATCTRVEDFANDTRGGDKHVLQNWDSLRLRLDGRSFVLRLGAGGGEVTGNFKGVAS
ncbi:hypothetical protein LRS74_32695 [Streptomyces sp. LX-29]|uniref:hypothetical protein n=1 Tax=Streptomyces sp. LX-29 TaxID=2900152 RepID=UPI00240E6FEF|nr:hypothetical protein [Streptomyces sp. LX-29]WFB11267.1 hypothetical protein LRS74_32695 [Streptomyces sp. LX-29]